MKRFWGCLAVLLVACSSSSNGAGDGVSSGNGSSSCADGFSVDPDGDGCVEVAAAEDCAAGTRVALGSTSCLAVAASACPDGFVVDPSGWGCRDVSPSEECASGTIEELGQSACRPIDDCNAAFPPSDATLFVGPSVTVDATHFTSIKAALAAGKVGAVIAIDSGTYAEDLDLKYAVHLVGRCAAQVVLTPPGPNFAGVQALGIEGVEVSGMTIRGFRGGIVEQQGGVVAKNLAIENSVQSGVVVIGGSLSLSHSRISKSVENGSFGFGAFASDSGALTLDGVVLADNPKAGLAANSKATVKVSRSIIRGSGPDATNKAGAGVAVSEAAVVTIDQSVVAGNMSSGVETYDHGSSVTITSSVLRDTRVDGAGNHGDGIALEDTATLTVTDSTVSGNAENGLIVIGSGTTATAKNTVFLGNGDSPQRGIGVSAGGSATLDGIVVAGARSYGLLVQDRGSMLDVTGSLVRDVVRTAGAADNEGTGVQAIYGARLTMTDSAIVNAVQVGLSVGGSGDTGTGSTATLTKVVVAGTHANAEGHFGRAVQCTDDSHTVIAGSAILGSQESGFIVGDGASAELHDSIVRKSGTNGPTTYGYGLVVRDTASMLVDHSSVRDNLGVALAFKSGSGVVKNTIIAHNAIGIFADGTTLNDVDQAPSEVEPDSVYVSDTKFVDNQTRVSGGDLPVPEVIK